jgi:hypothetical protein
VCNLVLIVGRQTAHSFEGLFEQFDHTRDIRPWGAQRKGRSFCEDKISIPMTHARST